MEEQKSTLVAWMRDAHAMERAALDNLRRQLRREGGDGHRALLEQQLQQHRRHLEQVEDCLDRLNVAPSGLRDAATRAAGLAEAWAGRLAPDDTVKNLLATHAYAWFGVGCYLALAEAADCCGEASIAQTCREIAEAREEAAKRLRDALPEAARRYMRDPRPRGAPRALPAVVRKNPAPVAAVAALIGAGAFALLVVNRRRKRPFDFEELYLLELQEILSAEDQVSALLEKVASACKHQELERLVREHTREATRLCQRLEALLERHGQQPYRHEDQSVAAMTKETRKVLAQGTGELGEAGLIASLQRLAHYQYSALGTVASWAGELGLTVDRAWLHEAAQCKKGFDEDLNRIAKNIANPQAAAMAAQRQSSSGQSSSGQTPSGQSYSGQTLSGQSSSGQSSSGQSASGQSSSGETPSGQSSSGQSSSGQSSSGKPSSGTTAGAPAS